MNKEYIKTQFGTIPIDYVPVVEPESTKSILTKCTLFYSIIIAILIIMFILVPIQSKPKQVEFSKTNQYMTNGMDTYITIDAVSVYNPDEPIPLENIVLIDKDNNIINIDITQNKAVKIYKYFKGLMYDIDLGVDMNIMQIGLISDRDYFIKYASIDLLLDGKKVWDFSGYLQNTRENFIQLTEFAFDFTIEEPLLSRVAATVPNDPIQNKEILLTNEKILGIHLKEQDENYIEYQ